MKHAVSGTALCAAVLSFASGRACAQPAGQGYPSKPIHILVGWFYAAGTGIRARGEPAAVFSRLPFDAMKDFTPILLFASIAELLVVHPSIPADSVKERVAFAKTRPHQLSFGSAGSGTASHFAGELMNMTGGLKVTHIPYKGLAPARHAGYSHHVGGRPHGL